MGATNRFKGGNRWIGLLSALLAIGLLAAPAATPDRPSETPAATDAPAPSLGDDHTEVVIGLEQELTNFNNLTAGDQLLAGRQIIRAV